MVCNSPFIFEVKSVSAYLRIRVFNNVFLCFDGLGRVLVALVGSSSIADATLNSVRVMFI